MIGERRLSGGGECAARLWQEPGWFRLGCGVRGLVGNVDAEGPVCLQVRT